LRIVFGAILHNLITLELTLMRAADVRGVELQAVYPLEVDDPHWGIRNTRYFSEEFNELLRHTIRETRRLGLQFDLTLGSGWSYGGPWLLVAESRLTRRLLGNILLRIAGPPLPAG
jgi:hypothetical protein